MADLYDLYAQQTGADANLLRNNDPNGNQQTTTSTPQTTNTTTTTTTTANNDPWSWNNTPTTTTTSTPTNNTPGLTLDDYYAYYGYDYTKADKDYNQWVTWMQSQTPTTPTTTQPTTPTNPTNPSDTTTTTPANDTPGLTMDDYFRYYGYDWSKADKSYDEWVAWMQNGGDTQNPTNPSNPSNPSNPTNPTNPSNPSNPSTPASDTPGLTMDDYFKYYGYDWTKADKSYDEWVAWMQNGGNDPSNPSGAPGSNIPGSNVTHNYPAVDMDNRQRINDMYDAQIEAQRAALQEQGDQALSDAQANRDKIASLYNKQRNAASVDWERQRRNFLEGANTSGLNTGAGSQAELSMMSMYQRAQNDLGAAQAQAEADADRNIADIKRSTQASINEAIAKNDYQKAAALLDEYNAEYNRAVERAEALGQYGDFSGYAALYGDEAAAQMRYTWIMSNPEIALAMGAITKDQYAQLVLYKQYPALALTSGAATGGGITDYTGYGAGIPADFTPEKYPAIAEALIQNAIDQSQNNG